MSHLTLQRSESSPSDSHFQEDSPTIGRVVVNYPSADTVPLPSLSISANSTKHQKPPAPSPLQTSTAISPPSSASPSRSRFPEPIHTSFPVASATQVPSRGPSQRSPSLDRKAKDSNTLQNISRKGGISPVSPASSNSRTTLASLPNDTRSVSDPIATSKAPVGSATATLAKMASGTASSRPDATSGAPRTSSIDSAISAISSRTHSHQGSQDAQSGTVDVANLIRAAGSPEAVIQYLLKEKQSQSQQNAQLWRLVDKQRAMILGLNKDLERALKDKEKYRKKLKEVMAAHDERLKLEIVQSSIPNIPQVNVDVPKDQEVEVPASPSNLDSDSIKHSPIDVSLAPYPITPPADQITNGMPSAVGELLDPSHAMPKASEHALDHFDHEEEDRAADEAKKASDASRDLPINFALPMSRSLPSEPPRIPPPKPPTAHPPAVSVIEATPQVDQGNSQFPPPSAPPPRKPPPAPLQLKNDPKVPTSISPEDENDSDSDYDSLLEVDELPSHEKRGRRRTREEDDREREILAQKEAEARSLSKKSKKGSQKGTPISAESESVKSAIPASPRTVVGQAMLAPNNMPASLAGMLSSHDLRQIIVPPPKIMSPGLPASPRPVPMRSPMHSPPSSPRGMAMGTAPLSPRAPRQPIPLPHNTPLSSPPSAGPYQSSIRLSNVSKQGHESTQSNSSANRESPDERTKIYKGFVTEEYPDLLLPPNALPSIEVKVASSRMKPSRASLLSLTQLEEDPVFTLAVFSRSEGAELWRVEKDTTSLAKLDQKMKQCASFTARTPDRSLFSGHSPAKLDARRTILDQYLDELLNTPLDTPTALELCRYLSTNTLRPNIDDSSSTNESSNENNAQKKGPGGRPFKNGYLTKRGKNFGGWKARFFVLDGPHLKYYEAPGGAHLGTIKLQSAQIGKQSQQTNDGSPASGPNGDEPDNQYRHAFLVLEPKKKDSSSHVKHVLCAESDLERDQWVDALLRWIDYRDGNEEEAQPSATNDRHQAGSNTNQSNAKKKAHGQGKQQGKRSSSQDGLIGMSYDSARQGTTPEGAPRHRKTGTPEHQDKANGPTYTISAPKDPQLIPDSASWGTKATLAPPGPTTEEKKQRKRSFFGFGPRARSSTDEDPLYGSNSSGPPGQPDQRGPIRQVFGAPLAEAVRYNGPIDVNVPLPAVVYRCIQYLDAKSAIREEGIFRLSGSSVVIKQLRERFNTESDVNLVTDNTYYDIHAVASLLKLYLRELPTTILTRDLHMKFVEVTEMSNQQEKISSLSGLVRQLPLANETLLKYLIAFLIKIINHADMNKMTVRNVGIVFSPTLNIPAPVFALLLQNYEGVFGIDPEEYELPSPSSDTDSRAPSEPQPPRPPTAGASDSPHRQRLMEQMQQRLTPTPPPTITGGGLRPMATPPPRQSYEPVYLAQHGSQTSLRPAYENGFVVPPGYDSSPRAPTYDRPHYGPSYEQDYGEAPPAAYDQSYKAKRRESTMLMGNMMLNQQGSRSRLREETRM